MQLSVACKCGEDIFVTEEAAGTTIRCRCGRAVEVPSLRALRAAAGAPMAAPPEWSVAHLLASGAALRRPCAGCGDAAERVLWCEVEYERARVEESGKFDWLLLLVSWLFLPLILFRVAPQPARQIGQDRACTVPLRLCEACADETSEAALKKLLRRVPEYRALLAKYPDARVSLAPGPH